MHIPSLEDMVAQDDGGLSWCVAQPLAPPSFPRSRVASDVSFSSSSDGSARDTWLSGKSTIRSKAKKKRETNGLTESLPVSFVFSPRRHPPGAESFADMLEDAIDADLDAFAHMSAIERTTSSRLGSLADPADGVRATRVRYDASPRNDDFESSLAAHERPMNQKNRHGWTDAEDCTLTALVRRFGCRKWSEVARGLGKRTGKQCRERWNNHVRPDIKRGAWTEAEELLLVDAHTKLGNRWADIAAAIPGRTENAVKNHWNATARRKDAPVAREGSSVVLREHLLRKRLGDEDADVVSYAVGGITERDIAALGLAAPNDARQTGAKRRRLPGASQMNISASLMSRSVSRSLRDDGGGENGDGGDAGARAPLRPTDRAASGTNAARDKASRAARRSSEKGSTLADRRRTQIAAVAAAAARAKAERESRVAAARHAASASGDVPFVSAEPAETNAKKSDGVPNGEAREKKPASSGSSSDGDSRPPSPKEVCHPADDLMVACMRRVRAQKGASYHFEGKHAPAAKQTRGLSRVPKKRPSRPARDASLPLSLGALGEKSREPVRTMPALPEPRVSDTSDISQWDLEPRGEAFREGEEDPTLAACAAAAAAAAAAARDRTGALSEEAWRGFLPDRHFLFKFDSMGPDPGPDAHDRDGLATVYDKTRSSPMDHLGSLAEDDADALDVMIARGVADGNARLVSGYVGNGSGGRHEQLDELEDLVATVGLHKAVACLRGALGTVAGDEIPPLVVRDGTNSCAGAMRADDREFFGSMLSG